MKKSPSQRPREKLTHAEAVAALGEATDLPTLARAVATLAEDPTTAPEELLPALDHPGFVAEQAAIFLHKRTGRPVAKTCQPVTSRRFWEAVLRAEGVRHRLDRLLDKLFQRMVSAAGDQERDVRDVVGHLIRVGEAQMAREILALYESLESSTESPDKDRSATHPSVTKR